MIVLGGWLLYVVIYEVRGVHNVCEYAGGGHVVWMKWVGGGYVCVIML